MSRKRDLHPGLFTNEELALAEFSTGLPLRIAYAGLWCEADREGRFEWKPSRLKLRILPFDSVDFEQVLNALGAAGFLISYAVADKAYGFIPTFAAWQRVHPNETPSKLPPPPTNGAPADTNGDRAAALGTHTKPKKPDKTPLQPLDTNGAPRFPCSSGPSGGSGPSVSSGPSENNSSSSTTARAKVDGFLDGVRSDSAAMEFEPEFAGILRSAQYPDSTVAEFRAMLAGLNMEQGRPATLAVLGQALRDIRTNRVPFTAQTLRIYAGKLNRPARAPRITDAALSPGERVIAMAERQAREGDL